jgi:hypothetical protein
VGGFGEPAPGAAGASKQQDGQVRVLTASPPPPAPARAVKAAPGPAAFDYEVTGGALRITPRIDGFLRTTVRIGNEAVTSPERPVDRGVAVTFGIPPSATSVLVTFSLRQTAGFAKSFAETAAPVLRDRTGAVGFPNASAEAVSLEIPLQ